MLIINKSEEWVYGGSLLFSPVLDMFKTFIIKKSKKKGYLQIFLKFYLQLGFDNSKQNSKNFSNNVLFMLNRPMKFTVYEREIRPCHFRGT